MARRYTAEQACKAILNDDDLGEMESSDSLDESFSNTSSSSCSEIDSDPANDYYGSVINVVTPTERGRPRTRTLNAQRIRGECVLEEEEVEVSGLDEVIITCHQVKDLLLILQTMTYHLEIEVQTRKKTLLIVTIGKIMLPLFKTFLLMKGLV